LALKQDFVTRNIRLQKNKGRCNPGKKNCGYDKMYPKGSEEAIFMAGVLSFKDYFW